MAEKYVCSDYAVFVEEYFRKIKESCSSLLITFSQDQIAIIDKMIRTNALKAYIAEKKLPIKVIKKCQVRLSSHKTHSCSIIKPATVKKVTSNKVKKLHRKICHSNTSKTLKNINNVKQHSLPIVRSVYERNEYIRTIKQCQTNVNPEIRTKKIKDKHITKPLSPIRIEPYEKFDAKKNEIRQREFVKRTVKKYPIKNNSISEETLPCTSSSIILAPCCTNMSKKLGFTTPSNKHPNPKGTGNNRTKERAKLRHLKITNANYGKPKKAFKKMVEEMPGSGLSKTKRRNLLKQFQKEKLQK